jgi:hypothetical protein
VERHARFLHDKINLQGLSVQQAPCVQQEKDRGSNDNGIKDIPNVSG